MRKRLLLFAIALAGCDDSLSEMMDLAMSVDAQPDADNGSPSTQYPAPHPPLPQLVNRTDGRVLTTPRIHLVFYPGYPYETELQTFAQKLSQSSYWATTTSEYGVGALSYAGTIELTGETPPTAISSDEIQTWVAQKVGSGAFGAPDAQAIYTLFYPKTTTITQPNPVSTILPGAQSCVAFSGYHNDAAVVGDGGSVSYAYAVIPGCGSSVDSITEVLSHEWVEAATDPEVTSSSAFTLTGGANAAYYLPDQDHLIWAVLGGGEAGDLCEPEDPTLTPSDVGHLVQRTWSNTAAAASHDPCVPEITPAFFDSAPVLPETVTLSSTLTGTVVTQGITIAVGESKTIEVDLFSDGDTGGPWTVSAADALSTYYGSYGLTPTMTFAWDRTQGQNGEKLHLTITVTAKSPISGAHAFMITSTLGKRKTVWPGLVIE